MASYTVSSPVPALDLVSDEAVTRTLKDQGKAYGEPVLDVKDKIKDPSLVVVDQQIRPQTSTHQQNSPKTSVIDQTKSETTVETKTETLECLNITKTVSMKKMMFFRGIRNHFEVKNEDRQVVYSIDEESSWWTGYVVFGFRPLQLKLKDGEGKEIAQIFRPLAITCRYFPCALQTMQVYSPDGELMGSINQTWAPITPEYTITDAYGEDLFFVKGPKVTLSLFRNISFNYHRKDGPNVGFVCKEWQNLGHFIFRTTIYDRYNVYLDKTVTPVEKTLLLAASLLLAYMYYDA